MTGSRLTGIILESSLLVLALAAPGCSLQPGSSSDSVSFCKNNADKTVQNSAKAEARTENNFTRARTEMVRSQLAGRDITDETVLKALSQVPRHEFVPDDVKDRAYSDRPLKIGHLQTISQPYVVAYMSQAIKAEEGDKVLEIGTGSGYQAAVLDAMGLDVYSIEIIRPLGEMARNNLKRLGYEATLKIGDGYKGMPKHAPFDAILVTASPKEIPPLLIKQLVEGGRLVIPVGQRSAQSLKVLKKVKGKLKLEKSIPVLFVPMTGKAAE